MKNLKQLVFKSAFILLLSSTAPIMADDLYLLNPDGPTGNPLVDTPYNLIKDLIITAEKFAFLPVEIAVETFKGSI